MRCALCHQPVDLFTLDPEGWGGLPAHADCTRELRADLSRFLADVEEMILDEPDPRRHRRTTAP